MKKSLVSHYWSIALLAAVGLFALSSNSHAVPAFARATAMECSTCHFHQFPLLNAFGRDFKANGYTMIKSEEKIEGQNLSIPHDLGASLVTKIRYQKTNGDSSPKIGTDRGELQFPDEAALFLGGRIAENIGFVLEAQLADDAAPAFASFKMPFVYDVSGAKLSIIPFTTDGLGASFGFELLNTGAVRNVRLTEHRTEVSAQQYLGTDGEATGVALVAYYNTGYVNYSLWKPVHGSSDNSYLNYLRIAATPQVAGWDLGAGIQLWSGKSKGTFGGGPLAEKKAEAWAVDAQAQGAVGFMPLGVYLTYGSVDAGSDLFNADSKATVIAADLGVLPSTQVTLAYRIADMGGTDDNAITFGAKYLLAQNVQLSLNHNILSGDANDDPSSANNDWGGDQKTTLMLFAAF